MHATKLFTRALAVAAVAALAVGSATAAQASPVPPKASPALSGTWVNVNAASRSVKQVVVAPTRDGAVSVDAFGSCSPTLCEWGRVPAIVYGSSVSSTTGTTFQARQRFLSGSTEWSRTSLVGHVYATTAGLRLSLKELTVFEDGSGRHNYFVTEIFKRGEGQKVTRNGHYAASYPHGAPPAMVAGMLGLWKNTSATGALVRVRISNTTAHPVVTAYGRCTPTPCNWGGSKAITYGASISSTRGASVLAPYNFSFKRSQLLIRYSISSTKVERLTVSELNEFTDGSGRSNYLKTETFVRV